MEDKKLPEVKKIDISLLIDHQDNPNAMTDGQFNKLNESISKNGLIENIVVAKNKDGTYTILSGHHRAKVLKYQGYTEANCVILDNLEEGQPNWEDEREFLLVSMNVIKGKIDPVKFTEMFNELNKRYAKDILTEMFGFADERAFNNVYRRVREALPDDLKAELDKAKGDIKNIDDLAKILNRLFSKYGNTLEYNFMIFDYGGKENIWVKCDKDLWKTVSELAQKCVEDKTDINEVIKKLFIK